MSTLLHIESSPRKRRSASLDVARAYVDAYRDAHPDHRIDVLDLWSVALPEFDGGALDAKYADLSGTPLNEAQQQAVSLGTGFQLMCQILSPATAPDNKNPRLVVKNRMKVQIE